MTGTGGLSNSPASEAPPQKGDITGTGQSDGNPKVEFFAHGTEMGRLMQSIDWTATPIGPVETWSPALRMMIGFMLANRFPLLLWWGPQYVSLYNDAYRPILGTKHPKSMGQPVSECWSEIWHILQPLIDTPFHGGPATWMEDIQLEINRHGFLEETHFTIAYSPVPDETAPRGIGGVLATVHEITEKVVGERRVVILRDLGARASEAKSAEEACAIAAETLAKHPHDIPFALIYLVGPEGRRAHLAGAAGTEIGAPFAPPTLDLDGPAERGWPLGDAMRAGRARVVEALDARFPAVPPGPWSDPPRIAVVLPIPSNKPHEITGLLVVGISARLKLDDRYRDFLGLAVSQIATTIANARAYEEERRRAEALAEIDRAKTLFFSNVSHEFRTPLTLMLGPLADALGDSSSTSLDEIQRGRLEVAHRNALRLLKLVNTLLDFSRIEAGRAQASYDPTDLARLTSELASNFRSACDRAGLTLTVDCGPLPELVHVDRDMWEKIVLNLLSNAFKFTFEGGIEVRLRSRDDAAELVVRDTGVGVPASELPRLFERFHRIEGQRGRSFEGSGIGLALVQELVRLHGGTITAESEIDKGTIFTVSVPFGTAHLPPDRIGGERSLASTSPRAEAYVNEALRWLPDAQAASGPVARDRIADGAIAAFSAGGAPTHVLVADDNADMRDYVCRLLHPYCEVAAAADGRTALNAIRRRLPDLVIADVMMPHLDGFGLLQEIRADPNLRSLPVIMLSARAGDEARIEGLTAGADDYLIKPFSARELLTRVGGSLQMARIRREADKALREEARTLEVLNRIGSTITAELDLERVVQTITDEATALTGAGFGSFFYNVTDELGERYTLYTLSGAPKEAFSKFPLPRNTAVFSPTFKGEGIVRSDDILQDPRYGKTGPHYGMPRGHLPVRSYLAAPVVSRSGEVMGGLFFGHPEPGIFSERAERLLKGIAGQAAIAIDNAHAYKAAQTEIIERRKAEQALGESERRLREIIDALPAAVYTTDADGRVTHFNPAAVEFSGRVPELGSDRWCVSWRLYHPDGRPMPHDECPMAIALKEGRAVRGAEAILERPDGTRSWFMPFPTPLRDAEGRVVGGINMLVDITERKASEDRQLLLMRELAHRGKNLLAVVQAIASRSLSGPRSLAEARDALVKRIQALARSQTLLVEGAFEGASVAEILRLEFDGFSDRVKASGPDMMLGPKLAQSFALLVHELATNATKYGALSKADGRIHVTWSVERRESEERFKFQWIERGGPRVRKPTRQGFGRVLIERVAAQEFNAEPRISFDPEGLSYEIDAPLPAIAD
jgi:PAS domain S-box-containing protein